MKLAYWMYAGPAHIGTLRIASSFQNVHAIMHAPLGDDYFNVMRSMLERERDYTPVTASIVDRHVLARGSQEKVVDNIVRKDREENPDLIVLTPTCTSSILQEDLANFVERAQLDAQGDVMLADVNHYRVNELQAADRTLQQIVQFYTEKARKKGDLPEGKTAQPSVNILGMSTLGFHNQHDCTELKRLMADLGIQVNEVIPEGASVHNLKNLSRAWFNLVPYRELGMMTAEYLQAELGTPYVDITPMGVVETARCIRQIQELINAQGAGVDYEEYNDYYGHQTGDDCLKNVAQIINQNVEQSNALVARYGGEEFAVVLPETDLEIAEAIAEKIRLAVQDKQLPHIQSKVSPYVSLSLGVSSQVPTYLTSTKTLIAAADAALYQAKQLGRNRVFSFTSELV